MRRTTQCLLAAVAIVYVHAVAHGAVAIWADLSSSPQKPGTSPTHNAAFDGTHATLAACANETEGLVVRVAGGGGLLAVSDLTGPQGARIPASAITAYQLACAAGGYLDAIVPRDRVTLGDGGAALLRIHVPKDAAPGPYQGTLHVGDASLPLRLTVWPQALPEKPTFHRNSPHWSVSTPKRDLGFAAAKAEFDALWRGRLTPAHAFWGKRPWWHFEQGMDVDPKADWPGTDEFYAYYFSRGGMQIDLDWYYAYPHGIRLKDGPTNTANAIRYLRTVYQHIQEKFGAGDRVFVQNRADEPTLGQGKPGRQHCEYAKAIAWAKVARAAVPELKILMAEHPAPQLVQWTDIFNSPWTHTRGPDARELEKLGKRLLWYSADIKSPAELHLMRATYWRAFAANIHGAWTWERYGYLPRRGGNYRYGTLYAPGKVASLPPHVPVASMKLEAAGEGHDDFEALRLLERWAADRFVALSFAQHSLRRTGPHTAPQATDLGPNDFAPLRRTLAFLLARKPLRTFTFKATDGLARTDNVELVTDDTGFARLIPASTTLATVGDAFGRATARVHDGIVRVEMTGGRRMCGVGFEVARVEPAGEVRFGIHVTPNEGVHDGLANMGLFDVYLRINGRYGTGVNWTTGEYNRTLGHWSDNGSFPGAWRSVRCRLAHTIDAPTSVESLGIAIGQMGHFDTNDPLPGQRYVVQLRNVRVTSRDHRSRGAIETVPVPAGDGAVHVWWVADAKPPADTRLVVEARRGDGEFAAATPLPGLVGVARVEGTGAVTLRLTLHGGRETPYVHAIGIVGE